jgi:hypothetical protein
MWMRPSRSAGWSVTNDFVCSAVLQNTLLSVSRACPYVGFVTLTTSWNSSI